MEEYGRLHTGYMEEYGGYTKTLWRGWRLHPYFTFYHYFTTFYTTSFLFIYIYFLFSFFMDQEETNEDKLTKQFEDYARFIISGADDDDTAQAITDRINTLKGIIFKGREIKDISVNDVSEIRKNVNENRKKILKAYEDFQKDRNTSNIKKTINGLNQRFKERFSSSPPSQSDTEHNEPSKLGERVRSVTSLVSSKGRKAIDDSKEMLKKAKENAGRFMTSIETKIASVTPPGNNAETNIATYTRVQDSIVGDPLQWFEWEKADTRTSEEHDRLKRSEARRRMFAIIKLVIKYKGKPGYDKIREEGKQEIIGMYTKCFGERANLRNLEDTYERYTQLPATEEASVSSSSQLAPPQVAPPQVVPPQVAPSQVAQSQDDETGIKDTQIKYKTMNGTVFNISVKIGENTVTLSFDKNVNGGSLVNFIIDNRLLNTSDEFHGTVVIAGFVPRYHVLTDLSITVSKKDYTNFKKTVLNQNKNWVLTLSKERKDITIPGTWYSDENLDIKTVKQASSAPSSSSSTSSTSTVPIQPSISPSNVAYDDDEDDDDDDDEDDDEDDPLGAHKFSSEFESSKGGKRRRHTIKKNRRSIRRTTIRRRQYKNKNKNNRSFKK